MAKIPENVTNTAGIYQKILDAGLTLVNRGKVRDTFAIPGHDDRLLMVASDRISIFDFVLNTTVPNKGQVLNALNIFWLRSDLTYPNHLITCGAGINAYLPEELWHNHEAQKRSIVVSKQKVLPFELIFRGHLGGSVWKQYQNNQTVAGIQLPAGLQKWQKLDEPIFTPSTKAEGAHDVNITVDQFFQQCPNAHYAIEVLKQIYSFAYKFALEKGILILDTKFEIDLMADGLVLIDEILTPDSSRFVKQNDLETALQNGGEPPFYDKQDVRKWGMTVETPVGVGLNHQDLKPNNPEHITFVHSQVKVPQDIIEQTSNRFLEIFQILTGQNLEHFQQYNLGIN